MLSLSNVGNGTTAASYYEAADDYYTGDHGPSAWWGAGAASLGLQGAVDASEFAALLDGRLPAARPYTTRRPAGVAARMPPSARPSRCPCRL